MISIEKWAERVYAETDFGRSIATSVAGIIGLVVYLIFKDWVIAAFCTIIAFPLIRLISTGLNEKFLIWKKHRIVQKEAERVYRSMSEGEKQVVKAFVKEGGSVLTWSHVNSLSLSSPSIESLIQREILCTSMTADSMRETFVLDSAIFDVAREQS